MDKEKSFSGKGIFPYKWAFTLLFPLRNIFLSPKQLINRLNLKNDMNILEVGAGPGYFSVEVAKVLTNGKLILADIQQEMLDYAKKRINKRKINNVDYYLCDGESFELENNSFDRIYMITVIGEVDNKDKYMDEFYRMLKPGGILSISEQAGDPDKMKIEEINYLAEEHGFLFDKLFGNKKRYTVNYKKYR